MGDIQVIQWVNSHGILMLVILAVVNTSVGYLPAPTKDSSQFYIWFFKVANSLMLSFARAWRSKVENSPNFDDAVKIAINGGVKNDTK